MAKNCAKFNSWCFIISAQMKAYRYKNTLGLRECARALDMSPATLSRIERGCGCDVATLFHIHERTGISMRKLMAID